MIDLHYTHALHRRSRARNRYPSPVKWIIMAAMTVDTMLQSNGFQTKKKEDVENKDNLWYVP